MRQPLSEGQWMPLSMTEMISLKQEKVLCNKTMKMEKLKAKKKVRRNRRLL
jgi:hypothetical protein